MPTTSTKAEWVADNATHSVEALFDAAPDAIITVGVDGRIVLVNAQTERLFGYPRDELIGESIEVLVPEADRAGHSEHRASYAVDPQPRTMGPGRHLMARHRDGSEFPAEIRLSAVETDAGVLMSASVRDVSLRLEAQAEDERLRAEVERERTDAQLHQSQRLESLGQLAGGVAHDFNNLLAVIINYAAFVGEEVAAAANKPGGEHWNAVHRDLEEISRAGDRATRLIHQLLAFARREVVRPQVLVLNDVVAEVEDLLLRTFGEGVELTTNLADDLWPVLADPGQIEQVLVNLAVNARDAMPEGGSLVIDTANVVADENFAVRHPGLEPGRFVRIRVSDTGGGMTSEVIGRAFEPFFTTKVKGEGSGLGLATVYGIITQAGGYAEIYSEPGFGTTFSALLPVTDKVEAPIERPVEIRRRSGGGMVLVVEDEDAIREVTRRILARNGYEVITAEHGPSALEIADTYDGTIDLLLTDVVMPQMLGKEVAERITQMRPGIRVLYMSGYAQPVLASPGTLDPGVLLVEKPFSEAALLAKVREALDGV